MLNNSIGVYSFTKSIFWCNNKALVDHITRISTSVASFGRNTAGFASSIYIYRNT